MKSAITKLHSGSSTNTLVDYNGPMQTDNKKCLLFVLDGKIEINYANYKHVVSESEMIILDQYCNYTISKKTPNNTVFFLYIPYDLAAVSIDFTSSSLKTNEVFKSYEVYNIRPLVLRIIDLEYNSGESSNFLQISYIFQILDIVIAYFSIESKEKTKRINLIVSYILSNYKNTLTLDDIANNFFIDKSYFSRLFKKEMGINFKQYLDNIRLEQACYDLINTEKNITAIALDNGFANSASFNQLFKKKKLISPSQYRYSGKIERNSISSEINDSKIDISKFEINQDDIKTSSWNIDLTDDIFNLYARWTSVVNIGSLENILTSKIKNQIRIAKTELAIKYVRVWDLMTPKIIETQGDKVVINEQNVFSIFDFLLENQILPWIDVAKVSKQNESLNYTNFTTAEWERRINKFVKSIVNRYHFDELKNWVFEFSYNGTETKVTKFQEYYQLTYEVIKNLLPGNKIGYGGFKPELFEESTDNNKLLHLESDFISFVLYPYRTTEESISDAIVDYSVNALINKAKKIKQLTQSLQKEIYITEWNSTLSNKDILNDHLYKGAYILNTLFQIGEMFDGLFYWSLADEGKHNHDNALLSGENGLMTKDNLQKPAMIAFKFLSEVRNCKVIFVNYNCIVLQERSEYKIIGHNHCQPSTMQKHFQDAIPVSAIDKLFDISTLKIKLNFQNIIQGSYIIRKYTCTHTTGNLLSTWGKFDYINNLSRSDIKYLSNIDKVELSLKKAEVTNNEFNLEVNLESNEFFIINLKKENI